MTDTTTNAHRPSLGDRIGIVIFMVAGAAIVIWSGIAATLRIMQVLLGEDVQAVARFVDVEVEVPIGPGGSTVPMMLDSATVTATHLSASGFGAAIASAALGFVVVTTIVVCLILLARGSLRGLIFSRGNTRLLVTGGMAALIGFAIVSMLDQMVANDILSSLSADDFSGQAMFVAEPMPFVLLAFAFGIVATAYTIGARMQRDQEGLI